MQPTDALVLQRQSTRPCLDFSRLKLFRIHLHAEFKLSSFTIPPFKGFEHILAHYTGLLQNYLGRDITFNLPSFLFSLYLYFSSLCGELWFLLIQGSLCEVYDALWAVIRAIFL